VVAIRVGALTLFVVVDPRLVRQMLVDKAHAFDKGRQFEKLRLWWGEGLLTSEGACHLRQRRLMQPAFHRQQVARYVQDMQQAAQRRVGSWPAGQVIQLDKEIYALLVTMITQNLFSTRIDEKPSRPSSPLCRSSWTGSDGSAWTPPTCWGSCRCRPTGVSAAR
jgi:cytochrome P450